MSAETELSLLRTGRRRTNCARKQECFCFLREAVRIAKDMSKRITIASACVSQGASQTF